MVRWVHVFMVLAGCIVWGTSDDVSLEGVKCIVTGKAAARADHGVEYKQGKVYLCCANCVAAYTKAPEKYAVKANHQLVLTGQYEQKSCPISGGKIDPDITADVGGVKVAFCCQECKRKVESAEGIEEKVKLIFDEEHFAQGFVEKSDDKNRALAK
jgi:YHS domain-containing protein